ncbi:MAG: hypothetical protein HRS50_00140 [Mycoplasmataceae bacterium]|nr:hypothetical protein [Mycoplasmataceae bacterium]
MEWKGIVILVTSILGVMAFIGILYDGWSNMRNAGTNSAQKHEIKKDMIRNIIFGAVVLALILGLESGIFYGILE